MNAIGALAYADWWALRNDARRALRSPGRVLLWLVYAAVLGLFVVSRAYGRARGTGAAASDVVRADSFVCVLLVTLALGFASGRGALGIFRSRAEARFIIGSPLPAPVAIAYLQAREVLAQGLRVLFSFVYLLFAFGPRHLAPTTVIADMVLVVAIVSAGAAIVVPRRLLPAWGGIACACAGVPLALVAAAPALRDLLTSPAMSGLPLPAALVARLVTVIPAWHPGRVLLQPNPLWLLAVIGVAAVAVAILAGAGRDAYPELYELSIARIDRFERRRMRRGRGMVGAVSAPPARRRERRAHGAVPAGVLVFVWKSVVEFGRQRRPALVIGGVVLWCLVGYGAALFVASDDEAQFVALLAVVVNIMLVVGISAGGALAGEIRRPLFWLAPAALFERLGALALARIWRTIASLELVAAGFAAGGGGQLETLVIAAGLPALVALLTGVGFAVFALYPSLADGRGPAAMLRLFASLFLVLPAFALYGIVATLLHAPFAALAGAVLIALLEAGALIGVAAWRLDGRVDRLAGA